MLECRRVCTTSRFREGVELLGGSGEGFAPSLGVPACDAVVRERLATIATLGRRTAAKHPTSAAW